MIEYFIEICDAYGNRMHTFMDFIEIHYSRADKQLGEATIYLPGRYIDNVGALVPILHHGISYARHSQLRIWRVVGGGDPILDGGCAWILTRPGQITERNGETLVELSFKCWRWILTTRVIAYNSDHDKAHHGETDIRNLPMRWFRDSFTPQTYMEPGRDLVTAGYLAQAPINGGGGVDVSGEGSWRTLYMKIMEGIELAYSFGIWEGFDFFGAGTGADFPWTFDVKLDQLSTDRTPGVHPNPVILSVLGGELTQSRIGYNYEQEATFVYGLGSGIGEDRLITSVQDAARIAGSPWGRIEAVTQQREAENIDEVTDAAQSLLEQSNPLREFSLVVEDTRRYKYGRDYVYGDKVSIDAGSERLIVRITGIDVTVKDGKEVKRLSFEEVK